MDCPICLENLNAEEDIIHLYCCTARYHKKCIHKWVLINLHDSSCPCCRSKLSIYPINKYYILQSVSIILIIINFVLICCFFYNIMFSKKNIYNSFIVLFAAIFLGLINTGVFVILNIKLNNIYNVAIYSTRVEIINPIITAGV